MTATRNAPNLLQPSLLALAAGTVLLALAVLAGGTTAKAHAAKVKTYKGGSKQDRPARLLLKVEATRGGVPKKVKSMKVVRGRASCAIGPNEGEFSPRRFGWRFPYPMVVSPRDRHGKKLRSFEGTQINGGAPTGGEEEEFSVSGTFARNRRSAIVRIEREFTVEGSAVESTEELVTCRYNARFRVKLVGSGKRR